MFHVHELTKTYQESRKNNKVTVTYGICRLNNLIMCIDVKINYSNLY